MPTASDSTAPAISVVLPVYNSARYLKQAIESILAQTFADFELICVNDGSTDSSLQILQALAAKDRRIQLISRANTGIVGALNDGIAAATGEFVARMDGDDVSLPTRFEKQIAFLRAHPEVVAVGCHVLRIDPDGLPIGPDQFPTDHATLIQHFRMGEGGKIPHPGVMIREHALTAIGGYREKYQWVEDLDLYLRLGEIGQLANLPEILLHYRLQLESVNATRQSSQAAIIRDCLAEASARTGEKLALSSEMQRWLTRSTSRYMQRQYWARTALASGYWKTARVHAGQNLLGKPFTYDHWRVFLLSLTHRQRLFNKSFSS